MSNTLIENIDKVHTTEMGVDRIRKNLKLGDIDVVKYCREVILNKDAVIARQGKNWYVRLGDCVITVNASSYTIITAHKDRQAAFMKSAELFSEDFMKDGREPQTFQVREEL
ncbi:MAG: DUF3781 domain-containing protein [Lachnospiraceae bacterium]|nr:DUF3781 domain-containing protein [Lachnospiraceae bacterium]